MPPQLILLLVQFGLTYGPTALTQITTLIKNPSATVNDVEAAFADLKPYSAYGIGTGTTPVVPTPVPTSPNTGTIPTMALPTASH